MLETLSVSVGVSHPYLHADANVEDPGIEKSSASADAGNVISLPFACATVFDHASANADAVSRSDRSSPQRAGTTCDGGDRLKYGGAFGQAGAACIIVDHLAKEPSSHSEHQNASKMTRAQERCPAWAGTSDFTSH